MNRQTRRSVLRTGAVGGALLFTGAAASYSASAQPNGKPDVFDPTLVNAVNVHDADEPTLRIDNQNETSADVKIHSTGPLDHEEFTVGANQAGYKGKPDDKPNVDGKFVPATCGEVITDVETKRPNDDTWHDSGFTGTATIGGAGCP